MEDFIWNDIDDLWNESDDNWNCETTPGVVIPKVRGGAFVDPRKKRHSHRWEGLQNDKKQEEKKFIKLVCLINGKTFEEKKYIGKKIKVQSFDEDMIITEVKKINVSVEEITNLIETHINISNQKDDMIIAYKNELNTIKQ